MAKARSLYICNQCGASAPKWQGQCPECGAWNTLAERRSTENYAGGAEVARLSELAAQDPQEHARQASGFKEFDRVLGGGLVPGSIVLLGGDPGVGKSTLLLQVAAKMPADRQVVYVSGEESVQQIADRGRRLGVGDAPVTLLAETRVEAVLDAAEQARAAVIVIDSIQTLVRADVSSAPGSVAQLRECVASVVRYAKQKNVTVLLIGHVTKEGVIAGPRVVEHMVDTVLYFESDPGSRFSVVRAVKNRFGASNEIGVFAMQADGFRGVSNPSAMFLSGQAKPRPGSAVTVAWEGSRPLLIEVQALVADAAGAQMRRLASGVDQNRLAMLLAVLLRHGGVSLAGQDVFVNVVGGMRITETAVDLPIVAAALSSFRDMPVNGPLLVFGELGLAGELRPVRFGEERLAEGLKQGYARAIVPAGNRPRRALPGLEVNSVETLADAMDALF